MRYWVLLTLGFVVGTAGCVVLSERTIRGGPLRKLPGAVRGGADGQAGVVDDRRWTLEVGRWTGGHHRARAWQAAQVIRDSGLPGDLWYREAGASVFVYFGRYGSDRSQEAQAALSMVQGLEVDGELPFAGARLAPVDPNALEAPTDDPLDIRRHAGAYTLAIGFYDAEFGKGFREAAEEAAQTLRDDGEEAYYYHLTQHSLVTLGVFDDRDFVYPQGVRRYGPRVRAMQARYPDFTGNGLALHRVRGGVAGERQKTTLVRVR
ncbi:MAG: hypothetical protein AAF288_04080 [Planctomycetota bacterium]